MRGQIEALLDELLGRPWSAWDAALSRLLDQAVAADEARDGA